MRRFLCQIIAVSFIFLTSCGKENEVPDRSIQHVSFNISPIAIEDIMPELKEMTVDQDNHCYSFFVPGSTIEYSYTPGRIWVEPLDTTFSTPPGWASNPESPDSAVYASALGSNHVIFKDVHKDDDIISVDSGFASGTMSLRVSLPESSPYDKVWLLPYSGFTVPVGLAERNDSVIRCKGKEIVFLKETAITREGIDLSFECSGYDAGYNDKPFYSNAHLICYPEDFNGGNVDGWEPTLNISFSTSVLEYSKAFAQTRFPLSDEIITTMAPFPKLKEQGLDHFNQAQVEVSYEDTDHFFDFKMEFISKTGASVRESDSLWVYCRPFHYLFCDTPDAIYREGLYLKSLKGLDDVIKTPAPDSIGIRIHDIGSQGNSIISPGHTYTFRLSSEWRIPLMLTGSYWGKKLRSPSIKLSEKDIKAPEGSIIYISGWVLNRQPFELKAVPVIVDADGVSHRFEDNAMTADGARAFISQNGEELFTIEWTAEKVSRPIEVYLDMTLGKSSIEAVTPGQDILYGIRTINKIDSERH